MFWRMFLLRKNCDKTLLMKVKLHK